MQDLLADVDGAVSEADGMTPRQIDAIVALGCEWQEACDELHELIEETCFIAEDEDGSWLDLATYELTISAKHAYDAIAAQIQQLVVESYVDGD